MSFIFTMARRCNLHPTEVEVQRALADETKKQRIFRLQQVRAQASQLSADRRKRVQAAEAEEVARLRLQLQHKCELQHQSRLQQLQEQLQCAELGVGEAHRAAQEEVADYARRAACQEQQRERTRRRGQRALLELRQARRDELRQDEQRDQRRRGVLLQEQMRAQRVSQLPRPSTLQLPEESHPPPAAPPVLLQKAGSLVTTHYPAPPALVTRHADDTSAEDAREAAARERKREEERERLLQQEREEQERRAVERGRAAVAREQLLELRRRLECELSPRRLRAFETGADVSDVTSDALPLASPEYAIMPPPAPATVLPREPRYASLPPLSHSPAAPDYSSSEAGISGREDSSDRDDPLSSSADAGDRRSLESLVSKMLQECEVSLHNSVTEMSASTSLTPPPRLGSPVLDSLAALRQAERLLEAVRHLRKGRVFDNQDTSDSSWNTVTSEECAGGNLRRVQADIGVGAAGATSSAVAAAGGSGVRAPSDTVVVLRRDGSSTYVDADRGNICHGVAPESGLPFVEDRRELNEKNITARRAVRSRRRDVVGSAAVQSTSNQHDSSYEEELRVRVFFTSGTGGEHDGVVAPPRGVSSMIPLPARCERPQLSSSAEFIRDMKQFLGVEGESSPDYLSPALDTALPSTLPRHVYDNLRKLRINRENIGERLAGVSRFGSDRHERNRDRVDTSQGKVMHRKVAFGERQQSADSSPSIDSDNPSKESCDSLSAPPPGAVTTTVMTSSSGLSSDLCNSAFSTPFRVYTEQIKADGLGQRPQRRRDRLEQQKRQVLQRYVQRLLHTRHDDLEQISSVDGSGIDISSSRVMNRLLNSDVNDKQIVESSGGEVMSSTGVSDGMSVTGASGRVNDSELDRVPPRLTSVCDSSEEVVTKQDQHFPVDTSCQLAANCKDEPKINAPPHMHMFAPHVDVQSKAVQVPSLEELSISTTSREPSHIAEHHLDNGQLSPRYSLTPPSVSDASPSTSLPSDISNAAGAVGTEAAVHDVRFPFNACRSFSFHDFQQSHSSVITTRSFPSTSTPTVPPPFPLPIGAVSNDVSPIVELNGDSAGLEGTSSFVHRKASSHDDVLTQSSTARSNAPVTPVPAYSASSSASAHTVSGSSSGTSDTETSTSGRRHREDVLQKKVAIYRRLAHLKQVEERYLFFLQQQKDTQLKDTVESSREEHQNEDGVKLKETTLVSEPENRVVSLQDVLNEQHFHKTAQRQMMHQLRHLRLLQQLQKATETDSDQWTTTVATDQQLPGTVTELSGSSIWSTAASPPPSSEQHDSSESVDGRGGPVQIVGHVPVLTDSSGHLTKLVAELTQTSHFVQDSISDNIASVSPDDCSEVHPNENLSIVDLAGNAEGAVSSSLNADIINHSADLPDDHSADTASAGCKNVEKITTVFVDGSIIATPSEILPSRRRSSANSSLQQLLEIINLDRLATLRPSPSSPAFLRYSDVSSIETVNVSSKSAIVSAAEVAAVMDVDVSAGVADTIGEQGTSSWSMAGLSTSSSSGGVGSTQGSIERRLQNKLSLIEAKIRAGCSSEARLQLYDGSSSSSLGDFDDVLRRLGWAKGMIDRMDQLDKDLPSTDSSTV